jgi:hypothetical protein
MYASKPLAAFLTTTFAAFNPFGIFQQEKWQLPV